MCVSQRSGNYDKWKIFDICLYKAIEALSAKECGSFTVFSGLSNVKLDKKLVKNGYFKTYVSASWNDKVANAFLKGKDGMIIQIHGNFKNNIANCCDECEILFSRDIEIDNKDNFRLKVLDDTNRIQIVSLALNEDYMINRVSEIVDKLKRYGYNTKQILDVINSTPKHFQTDINEIKWGLEQ